jgi:hypothetical protein
MNVIEFLQTPEGLKVTMFVTVMVIAAAFLIGAHPFKSKTQLVLSPAEDPNLWVAGDYFAFLSSLVRSSATLEDLAETMPLIEAFFDKPFRVPVSNYQLKRYYARLLQVYCAREKELETIPVELCKN